MTNPNYIIIKLEEPVGPDDAQDLAAHLVRSIAFADVEWAQPALVYANSETPPAYRLEPSGRCVSYPSKETP